MKSITSASRLEVTRTWLDQVPAPSIGSGTNLNSSAMHC